MGTYHKQDAARCRDTDRGFCRSVSTGASTDTGAAEKESNEKMKMNTDMKALNMNELSISELETVSAG